MKIWTRVTICCSLTVSFCFAYYSYCKPGSVWNTVIHTNQNTSFWVAETADHRCAVRYEITTGSMNKHLEQWIALDFLRLSSLERVVVALCCLILEVPKKGFYIAAGACSIQLNWLILLGWITRTDVGLLLDKYVLVVREWTWIWTRYGGRTIARIISTLWRRRLGTWRTRYLYCAESR